MAKKRCRFTVQEACFAAVVRSEPGGMSNCSAASEMVDKRGTPWYSLEVKVFGWFDFQYGIGQERHMVQDTDAAEWVGLQRAIATHVGEEDDTLEPHIREILLDWPQRWLRTSVPIL